MRVSGPSFLAHVVMTNVLDDIRRNPRPLDAADWWKQQPPSTMADPLDGEEQGYLEFFTSDEVPPIIHIGRGIASPAVLTSEEQERAKKYFGTDPAALQCFANYENRRRIIAHYTLTHPATVQYELGLYRFSRDVIPPFFVFERIHELITGKEAFTDQDVSRLHAGIDLLIPVAIGAVFKLVRIVPTTPELTGSLSDPIWGLPPEGGGMRINGRWYTEHALERMAPRTPQIQQELNARVVSRLQRAGLRPGSPAWQPCLDAAVKDINPRGVPPSVVEAEIQRPGSTGVKVITAKAKQVVVTVIPRRRGR